MNKFPLPIRSKLLLLAVLLTVITLSQSATLSSQIRAAGPLSQQDEITQWLQEPHSGLVDGQSLRLAIQIVAETQTQPKRHINTWLDRKVNPDLPVSPGSLGPTRYASLCKIAKSAGCVCYPLDNCILIGRPAWVAELSRDAFLAADHSKARTRRGDEDSASIDIHWPDLTTPTEAMQIVGGHSAKSTTSATSAPALPHDLWPEIRLRDISPQLVRQLIVGQFLDDPHSSRIGFPFARSYRFTGASNALDSLQSLDPNLKTQSTSGWVRLLGSPAAHQSFCQQMLSIPDVNLNPLPPNAAAGSALDRLKANERVFSMEVKKKPAGLLIKQLTAQLGIDCQFDPAANPQLEKLVSFTAVDQTLWQLVRLITGKASLKIDAAGDKLHISAMK